jgi:hypothetical protein
MLDIIYSYLRTYGYDGLAGDDCGCQIDDLCPCENCCINCVPAYKVKPTQDFIDEWGESEYMMSLSNKGRIIG